MPLITIIRGGGDLASGAALRLFRVGIQVVITELPQPVAVRRMVSFAQAVYDGQIVIEGVTARLATDPHQAVDFLEHGILPVLIDPLAEVRTHLRAQVLIDGRMRKRAPEFGQDAAPLVIGLGPGFTAGEDCHAVVETKRGPFLGRVYYEGSAEPDSGEPDTVGKHQTDRVLRAPVNGRLNAFVAIGDHLEPGQRVAEVNGQAVTSPFSGRLRGLMMDGLKVPAGEKIGDVDPRDDARLCWLVSDKALAVGGAVLEAILARQELRSALSPC